MLAILCPGQGSQTPGFLSPWLELDGALDLMATLSDAAGVDLVTHGTTSDAETIRDTAVAQPLIVAAGILSFAAVNGDLDGRAQPGRPGVTAGHSVGEITAAVVSEVFTRADAMTFVRERSQSMAVASAVRPTGMTAVLGGDLDQVRSALDRHGLTPANINGAGQVVAAGTTEQLAALAADPPAKARLIPLSVAGAFHTVHMEPAVARLAARAESLSPANGRIPMVSNREGASCTDGDDLLQRLVDQVSNPVRWDLCMATMTTLRVTGAIELAPAGTLVGLAKRGMKGVETLAVKTPDDLEPARTLCRSHGASEVAA